MSANLKARLERLEQRASNCESLLIIIIVSYVGAKDGNLGVLTGVELDGEVIERDLESETEQVFLDRVRDQDRRPGRSVMVVTEQRLPWRMLAG